MTTESPAGLRTPTLGRRVAAGGEVGRVLAVVLLGVLILAALVLVWRRLAGALESPLPGAALPLVALGIAGVAAGGRFCWRLGTAAGSFAWLDRPIGWLPVAAVGLLGASLSLPGTPPGALAAFWLIVAAEEFWSLRPRRPIERQAAMPRPAAVVSAGHVRYDRPQTQPTGPVSMLFGTEEISPDDVTQQLTRSHSVDGSEVLSGWLRVELAPGQRSASLHVAFCPPFVRIPTLAIEQYSGPSARIKTVQLLPYGTRLDLKLDQPSQEAAGVLLQFLARVAPEDSGKDDGVSG